MSNDGCFMDWYRNQRKIAEEHRELLRQNPEFVEDCIARLIRMGVLNSKGELTTRYGGTGELDKPDSKAEDFPNEFVR